MNWRLHLLTLLCCLSLLNCGRNPLLEPGKTPFAVPEFDRIKLSHFEPAFKEAMRIQNVKIKEIVDNKAAPGFKNTIEAIEYSGVLLRYIRNIFFSLTWVNNNDKMRVLSKKINPLLSKHWNDILLHKKLFERVKAVYKQRNSLKLNTEQLRLVEVIYKDFISSGAGLDETQKARLKVIDQKLSVLGLEFRDNLVADSEQYKLVIDNKADLDGLPKSIIASAAHMAEQKGLKGKWVFTLDSTSMWPFLENSIKRQLREKIYNAYSNRGNNNNSYNNKKIIQEVYKLRREKAQLLGFKNFAAYQLDRYMAKNPANVYSMLNKLWAAALPKARSELDTIQKQIRREGKTFTAKPWDVYYYANKLYKKKYQIDGEMVKQYLPMDAVFKGLFYVVNKLYGLTFNKRTDLPVYHPDVVTYEVKDSDGTHLGIIYFDLYSRTGKQAGAWCRNFRKQYWLHGKKITPVINVVTNFARPTKDTPSLVSVYHVRGHFFHEMGHALHSLLSNSKYWRISGMYVPRDYVELPSQIMENYAFHPHVVQKYAFHYKTGKPMPKDMIIKLQKGKFFGAGRRLTGYLASAILDMDYHSYAGNALKDPVTFEKNCFRNIGLPDAVKPWNNFMSFKHIFTSGYWAGYYSYIWAEVLSADAFTAFTETGNIFDKKTAKAFRKHILSTGYSEEPMVLYKRFRGRAPSIRPLLKSRGF